MTAFAFAACGGGEGGGEGGGNNVKGETGSWGKYTEILVPEGMTLKGGNILDENDPTIVKLNDTDNEFHWILFNIYDEDTCKSSIASTKEVNNGEDVTIEINGTTWTGVSYKSLSADGFQMYGQVDGQYVLAGGFYYAYDSAVVQAVIASLHVTE